jgi:hypothetical protein
MEPGVRGQRQHPGQKGGSGLGPNPTDRAKPGVKIHLVTDARGLPLVARCEPANRHDSVWFEGLIDAIPPTRTPSGQRRRRPGTVHADKGHDRPRCHRPCAPGGSGIASPGWVSTPRIGWVRTGGWSIRAWRCSSGCGGWRFAFQAFVTLACCLICHRRLAVVSGL